MLLIGLGLAGAVPASGDSPRVQRHSVAIEAPKPLPDIANANDALTLNPLTAGVRKAKVQFEFPTTYLRSTIESCGAQADSNGKPGPGLTQACIDLAKLPLPQQYQYFYHQFTIGLTNSYVVSSPGPTPSYGFLSAKVRTLAFGSLPVTATVRLTQTSTRGFLNPIRAQYVYLGGINDGEPAYPGFGLAPVSPFGSSNFIVKLSVQGSFNVHLSDVTLDGRRVDVGPNCRTVDPTELTINTPQGYVPYDADPSVRFRGRPGTFIPVFSRPAGWLDGNASISRFIGCTSGKDDLSGLLTRLVSGSSNPVSAFVPIGYLTPGSNWCALPIAHCTSVQSLTQRKNFAFNAAVAAHKSPAVLKKLQAQLKPSDVEMPKVKAPKGLAGS